MPNQSNYWNQRVGYQSSYNNRPAQQYNTPQPVEIKPLPVPADYVDAAEKVMTQHMQGSPRDRITTTKLRGFLALIDEIYNVENLRTEEKLLAESKLKIMRLRVRVLYDAGREPVVKKFVEQAKLLSYLKGIGDSREAAINLAHYMEALVAYHRYLGGKEN